MRFTRRLYKNHLVFFLTLWVPTCFSLCQSLRVPRLYVYPSHHQSFIFSGLSLYIHKFFSISFRSSCCQLQTKVLKNNNFNLKTRHTYEDYEIMLKPSQMVFASVNFDDLFILILLFWYSDWCEQTPPYIYTYFYSPMKGFWDGF